MKRCIGRLGGLVLVALVGLGGWGCSKDPAAKCPSESFSCGDPAGGPECCRHGTSCCFGYDLCCDETKAHLGRRRSDGAKLCYQSLAGEGSTWDLLTVCGKPAG